VRDEAWTGTWRQSGQAVPLILTRTGANASKPTRPQETAIAARDPDIGFVVMLAGPGGARRIADGGTTGTVRQGQWQAGQRACTGARDSSGSRSSCGHPALLKVGQTYAWRFRSEVLMR